MLWMLSLSVCSRSPSIIATGMLSSEKDPGKATYSLAIGKKHAWVDTFEHVQGSLLESYWLSCQTWFPLTIMRYHHRRPREASIVQVHLMAFGWGTRLCVFKVSSSWNNFLRRINENIGSCHQIRSMFSKNVCLVKIYFIVHKVMKSQQILTVSEYGHWIYLHTEICKIVEIINI